MNLQVHIKKSNQNSLYLLTWYSLKRAVLKFDIELKGAFCFSLFLTVPPLRITVFHRSGKPGNAKWCYLGWNFLFHPHTHDEF